MITAVALLVHDYDVAIAYFRDRVGFVLLEDTKLDDNKRWVRMAPRDGGAAILLARATSLDQQSAVGNQSGGRVMFFLETASFDAEYEQMRENGVRFEETPRSESFGKVAVFKDLYGNRWDLIGRGK